MDSTGSSFTLRENAKRAAEAMIRKGTAPAVEYGIKPSDNGGFEIVWKIAKAVPTTDKVETEIAEASAVQPVAASLTEAASQSAPAATEPATTEAAPQRASSRPVRLFVSSSSPVLWCHEIRYPPQFDVRA